MNTLRTLQLYFLAWFVIVKLTSTDSRKKYKLPIKILKRYFRTTDPVHFYINGFNENFIRVAKGIQNSIKNIKNRIRFFGRDRFKLFVILFFQLNIIRKNVYTNTLNYAFKLISF